MCLASLLENGEAWTCRGGKPNELRGSVLKRRWERIGWVETEWSRKAEHVKQGDLDSGESCPGVRASIIARKHRNGCGAKGGRKVEA